MNNAGDEAPVRFDALIDLLLRLPAIDANDTQTRGIGRGNSANRDWWVKFGIRIDDPLAWRLVQEFAFVINSISIKETLPATFKPVSPPPYLNGGPRDYLSWVIECHRDIEPKRLAEILAGYLPDPVDDRKQWQIEDD